MDLKILKRFGIRDRDSRVFVVDYKNATYDVRPLSGAAEFAACMNLQTTTWGLDARSVVPDNVLEALCDCNVPALGAFSPNGQLLGILFGFIGIHDEIKRPFLHSHMLAVSPDFRSQGVGTTMKIIQAELCHRLGIEEMEWTVDPLRPNWAVNVRMLGGITRTYLEAKYNVTGHGIYAGYPADRVVLRWPFNSYWTTQRLLGNRKPVGAQEVEALPLIESDDHLHDLDATREGKKVRVEVPADIDQIWRTRAPMRVVRLIKPGSRLEPMFDRYFGHPAKRAERARTRPIFQKLFDGGYTAVDFVHDSLENKNYVVFERGFVLN